MGLTQIVVMDGSRTPLMLEVPVAPDLGPYLVTSSKDLMWIGKAFPNGAVRTAVRSITKPSLYRSLLTRIVTRSRKSNWGSVQPPTVDGMRDAINYLADYGLLDIEVQYGEGFDTSVIPDDIPTHAARWVPPGWAAVLPADRDFVGTTFEFGEGKYATLIHNAARGVCVLATEGVVESEVLIKTLIQEGALPRAAKILHQSRLLPIQTLGQLAGLTRKQLLAYKGIGPKAADKIQESLAERGFSLADA